MPFTSVCMCACMHVPMCACVHVPMCACMYMGVCSWLCASLCVYTCTCSCMCVCRSEVWVGCLPQLLLLPSFLRQGLSPLSVSAKLPGQWAPVFYPPVLGLQALSFYVYSGDSYSVPHANTVSTLLTEMEIGVWAVLTEFYLCTSQHGSYQPHALVEPLGCSQADH
jgi:hypothetical protein